MGSVLCSCGRFFRQRARLFVIYLQLRLGECVFLLPMNKLFKARIIGMMALLKNFPISLKLFFRGYFDGDDFPLSTSYFITIDTCWYFLIDNPRLTNIMKNREITTDIHSKFSNSTYSYHEECLFTYLPVPLLTEQHKPRDVCLQFYKDSS